MFKPLKKLASRPGNRKLLENFFSLSMLQGSVYLLNFITFPYLVRVLGPEKFGLVVFAQVFAQYFNLVTDYGFNLTATREISVNRNDHQRVSEIFSSVLFIKISLLLTMFLVLVFILLTIDKFRSEYLLYLFAFGYVAGNVMFPIWFFQGMEKMKYITFLNLTAKLIFTVSIFLFIKKPAHYPFVVLLNSLGFLVAGILSLQIVRSKFGIHFRCPSKSQLLTHLREGLYIFISSISANIYKTIDIFILGLFTSELLVGYYSIAKKFVDFANQFAVILSQTIYPRISKIIRESFNQTFRFVRNIELLIMIFTATLGIIFFFFAPYLIYLVSGQVFPESVFCLKLLAFVPFIIGLNVPAVQLLLGANLDKVFSQIVTAGALVMIILNLVLVPSFSYKGAGISFLTAETLVTIILLLYLKTNIHKIRAVSQTE